MARNNDDWTAGPAKHAAVAALLLATACAAWIALDRAPIDGGASLSLPDRRIDVNAAGEAELRLLPDVGPALAARIVEERERNGPYAGAEDLQRVRGIGPRTAEGVAPFVVFGEAEPPPD